MKSRPGKHAVETRLYRLKANYQIRCSLVQINCHDEADCRSIPLLILKAVWDDVTLIGYPE